MLENKATVHVKIAQKKECNSFVIASNLLLSLTLLGMHKISMEEPIMETEVAIPRRLNVCAIAKSKKESGTSILLVQVMTINVRTFGV